MNVTSFEYKGIDERYWSHFWFTHIFTERTWRVKGYWGRDARYLFESGKVAIPIFLQKIWQIWKVMSSS